MTIAKTASEKKIRRSSSLELLSSGTKLLPTLPDPDVSLSAAILLALSEIIGGRFDCFPKRVIEGHTGYAGSGGKLTSAMEWAEAES